MGGEAGQGRRVVVFSWFVSWIRFICNLFFPLMSLSFPMYLLVFQQVTYGNVLVFQKLITLRLIFPKIFLLTIKGKYLLNPSKWKWGKEHSLVEFLPGILKSPASRENIKQLLITIKESTLILLLFFFFLLNINRLFGKEPDLSALQQKLYICLPS